MKPLAAARGHLRAVGETLALWWRMRRSTFRREAAGRPCRSPRSREGRGSPGDDRFRRGCQMTTPAGTNVTRDDPVDLDTIAACLDVQYDLREIGSSPLGYDLNAAVYKVIAEEGTAYFLKIRFGPVDESGLIVPWALSERGIRNVLAPLQTRSVGSGAPAMEQPGSLPIYRRQERDGRRDGR